MSSQSTPNSKKRKRISLRKTPGKVKSLDVALLDTPFLPQSSWSQTQQPNFDDCEVDVPITQQERFEFKELFDVFDVDEDGGVTAAEIERALTGVGKSMSRDEATAMVDSIALGAERFTFGQFLNYMANLKWEEMESKARENFMEFGDLDEDGKMGYVTEDQLKTIFHRFIGNVPDSDVERLINHCDPECTGQIAFDDFFRLLMAKYKEGSITKDTAGNFWWQPENDDQRMKKLDGELTSLRKDHFLLLRDLEGLTQKENEEREAHCAQVEELQLKLADLESKYNEREWNINKEKGANSELIARLEEELAFVRSEYVSANQKMEEMRNKSTETESVLFAQHGQELENVIGEKDGRIQEISLQLQTKQNTLRATDLEKIAAEQQLSLSNSERDALCDQLASAKASFESEKRGWEEEQATSQQNIIRLQQEIARLISERDNSVLQMIGERDACLATIDLKSDQIQQMEIRLHQNNSTILQLEEKNSESEQRVIDVSEKAAALLLREASLTEALSNVTQKLETQQSEVSSSREAVSDLELEISTLMQALEDKGNVITQLEEAQRALTAQLEEANKQHATSQKTASEEVEGLQCIIQSLKLEKEQLTVEIGNLQQSVAASREDHQYKVASFEADLDRVRADALHQAELYTTNAVYLQDAVQGKESIITGLERDLESEKETVKKLTEEVALLEETAREADGNIKRLKEQLDDMIKQAQREEADKKNLEQQLQATANLRQKADENVSSLEERLGAIVQQKHEADVCINDLESRVNEITEKNHKCSADIVDLLGKKSAADVHISHLNAKLGDMQAQQQQAEMYIRALEENLSALKKQQQQADNMLLEAAVHKLACDEEIANLQTKNADACANIRKLEDELGVVVTQKQQTDTYVQNLEERLSEMTNQKLRVDQHVVDLQCSIADAKEQKRKYDADISEMVKIQNEAELNIHNLEEQVGMMVAQKKQADVNTQSLEQQITLLTAQKQQADVNTHSLEGLVAELNDDILLTKSRLENELQENIRLRSCHADTLKEMSEVKADKERLEKNALTSRNMLQTLFHDIKVNAPLIMAALDDSIKSVSSPNQPTHNNSFLL